MKRKFLITSIMSLALIWGTLAGQETENELVLSLDEAQEYAIQHNKMVISARLDVNASKMALWEMISAGLPQVSSSAGITDNIKQMVFLMPDFFGGTDTKIPITMGSQYNASVGLQASMLLFNAPYLVGIETTKLAKKLAETNVSSTELDVREAVTSVYYLILVSEESLRILNGNLENLRETLKSTRTMFNVGMAESTDVDQMVSNVNMVENSRSMLERTMEMNYNLLRFQLGVESDTKIRLTGTLDDLTQAVHVEELLSQEFNYTNNLSYKLIEGQEQLSELGLKAQKAQVLPTLAGVIQTTKTGMGDKMSEIDWYNSSLIALQLSVPIIASGQRYARIKKAQINLEKARNTKDMISDQLRIQEKQLRYNLVNANLQYKSQKDNVEVSRRVYTSTENKFKQGMASSLELTQANSLYLQAENNYVSALMNLLQTKLALDKLLNNM
ncbi:MAG: TolC family protein [Bacteroidia bacterium]|nr:TolC family protein [Bacteroidia bacterium]